MPIHSGNAATAIPLNDAWYTLGMSDGGAEADVDTERDGLGVVEALGPATRSSITDCDHKLTRRPLRVQPAQNRTNPDWLEVG